MTDRTLTTSAVSPAVASAMEVYERMATVRDTLAPELNNSELSLFALVADRSGLDPFAKQIYAIKRAGRVTFQTGIDGYRSIAARTGQYEGSSDAEFGEWTDAPFPHPVSCTVIVYRWQNGRRIEQAGTAWWDEYYPGEKGKVPSGPRDTGYMWLTKPRVMISKVAEAIALRKAFPYLLADLYVREEMEAAGPPENTPLVTAAAQPTARERMAARRAALEAAPVQDAPHDIEEAEVVSESTDEPETAPDPGACPVRSPYEDGAACVLPVGHKGNHKSEGRETWA